MDKVQPSHRLDVRLHDAGDGERHPALGRGRHSQCSKQRGCEREENHRRPTKRKAVTVRHSATGAAGGDIGLVNTYFMEADCTASKGRRREASMDVQGRD